MAIYKYLTHEEHVRAFVETGSFLMKPLSHFCHLEDGLIRGDRHEGLLAFAPPPGLELTKSDGSVVMMEGWRFLAQAKLDEIFVFCAGSELSQELAERFDNSRFCVEIPDPQVLVDRLRARADRTSKLDYQQIHHGYVEYVRPEQEPGADWALPERVAFRKLEEFDWQNEYRIALGVRGAFNVENVICMLHTGPLPPPAPPANQPLMLNLGSLEEHARVHRF